MLLTAALPRHLMISTWYKRQRISHGKRVQASYASRASTNKAAGESPNRHSVLDSKLRCCSRGHSVQSQWYLAIIVNQNPPCDEHLWYTNSVQLSVLKHSSHNLPNSTKYHVSAASISINVAPLETLIGTCSKHRATILHVAAAEVNGKFNSCWIPYQAFFLVSIHFEYATRMPNWVTALVSLSNASSMRWNKEQCRWCSLVFRSFSHLTVRQTSRESPKIRSNKNSEMGHSRSSRLNLVALRVP